LQPARAIDLALIARVFAELEAEALAWLDAERVPESARRIRHQASLRYRHQGFELFVPWDSPGVTEAGLAATVAAFHQMHERLYTFSQEDTPVEVVTLSVAAEGVFPPPQLQELPPGGSPADAVTTHQTMRLEGGPVQCPVYDRARLGAGALVDGPAIVTQLDSTTLILPGQAATVDRFGNLLVTERS
jgi:N-methylhydantoinase A